MPGDETSIIPVVISVDVEPDGPGHVPPPPGPLERAPSPRTPGSPGPGTAWPRSRAARRTSPGPCGWTRGVEAVCGSPPMPSTPTPSLFTDAAARGDELGVHVHGWRRCRTASGSTTSATRPGSPTACRRPSRRSPPASEVPAGSAASGTASPHRPSCASWRAEGVAFDLTVEPAARRHRRRGLRARAGRDPRLPPHPTPAAPARPGPHRDPADGDHEAARAATCTPTSPGCVATASGSTSTTRCTSAGRDPPGARLRLDGRSARCARQQRPYLALRRPLGRHPRPRSNDRVFSATSTRCWPSPRHRASPS